MARKKTAKRGRKPKLSMDERLKAALAEAKRLQKLREEIDTAGSKLSDVLANLADEMREIEAKHDGDRVTSDDLDNAANEASNGYGSEQDYGAIICYLEGKHGC